MKRAFEECDEIKVHDILSTLSIFICQYFMIFIPRMNGILRSMIYTFMFLFLTQGCSAGGPLRQQLAKGVLSVVTGEATILLCDIHQWFTKWASRTLRDPSGT